MKIETKIVFIGTYNKTEVMTGPEKVAKKIYNIASEKYNCEFWEYFQDGEKYSFLKKLFGYEVLDSNKGILMMGLVMMLLRALLLRPKYIHIIIFRRYVYPLLLINWLLQTKIVYNIHGLIYDENKYDTLMSASEASKNVFIEKTIYKKADKILFLSKKYKEIAIEHFNANKEKFIFVPNGIDMNFRTTNSDYKVNRVLKGVFIGDLSNEQKGFPFLRNALEKIDIPLELHCINTNSSVCPKIAFANHNVIYIEHSYMPSNELHKFLTGKDIYFSPSSFESFNLAAVEAMATGLVPIVTNDTGMCVYIEDGKNGFLFEYGKIDIMVDRVRTLHDDSTLLINMKKEAKNIYLELNWGNVFEKYYRKIYE